MFRSGIPVLPCQTEYLHIIHKIAVEQPFRLLHKAVEPFQSILAEHLRGALDIACQKIHCGTGAERDARCTVAVMFADPFFLLGAAKTGQQDVGLHLLQRLSDICYLLRLFLKSHAGRECARHHQTRITGLDVFCCLAGRVFFSAQHKDRAAFLCRSLQQCRHEVRAGHFHLQRSAIQLRDPDERLSIHQRQVCIAGDLPQHKVCLHLHHDIHVDFHHIGRGLFPYLLQQKFHRFVQRDIVDIGIQQPHFFHCCYPLSLF